MTYDLFPPPIWRKQPDFYHLQASFFPTSGRVYYPVREVDPEDGDRDFKIIHLEHTGVIEEVTVQRVVAYWEKTQGPYALAIIRTDGERGTTIMAKLTDCDVDKVKPGMKVRATFRVLFPNGESGAMVYGWKWVPDMNSVPSCC